MIGWTERKSIITYLLVDGPVKNGQQGERNEIHDDEVKRHNIPSDIGFVIAKIGWDELLIYKDYRNMCRGK